MLDKQWLAGFILAGLCLLTGCSHPPMQFYMLDAETGFSGQGASLPGDISLGLGPIHLPAYLDRPQIVTAVGEHEYQLDEQHRWAERLDDNILRALSQSLAKQLGIAQIIRHPWPQRQMVDYQISADILSLHQTTNGINRFEVQWQLKKVDQAPLVKRFSCEEPSANEASAIVAAQSRCLTRWAVEMAEAVKKLSTNR